ncbi:MAG: hypothetical protein MUC42_07710, partial [Bryobacter sp.]|nr:hypothetical protein [Bryobacter sp.]
MSRISLSERSDPSTTRWQQVYLGVAFTTVGALLLELALTRIFSVVFYYHFAFLAISIALFGLGAGGILSYVVAGWRRPLYRKLGGLSAAVALLIPAALVFALSLRSEPTGLTLAAVYFIAALPFMGAGAIISLVISATMERVDRVYFFDLIGAAAGCLLLVPFLNVFGGPNTVLAAAVFFSAAAAIWWNIARNPVGRAAAVALSLALVALMTYNQQRPVLDVAFAKGMKLGPERFVKWNSFSRISVGPEPGSDRQRIVIDADAATGIPDFDLDRLTEEQRRALLRQGPALPYLLRPGAKTLIIGPGGGWDVARAVATGSRDITGVEINPIIAETVMRGRLADLSRRLYFRPEVRIVVEDGRSFLRRTGDQYQVIQATLVDTWASTAAGAFALSENNLYTTEAFVDYLKHLRPDGVLGMTRWGFEPPRESVRVLALTRAALELMGEREPWRHVAVGREGTVAGWGAQDTILLFRRPVEDVERVRAAMSAAGLEKVYLPGDTGSPFAEVLRTKNLAAFYQSYRYDISPVGDDRPFFFYTVQPRDLWNFLAAGQQDSADYKINKAIPLLFGLMGISVAATLIVLALPPLLLGARLPVQ